MVHSMDSISAESIIRTIEDIYPFHFRIVVDSATMGLVQWQAVKLLYFEKSIELCISIAMAML